ncbi:putative diguanylate cyclase AdrA [compost metagenome]
MQDAPLTLLSISLQRFKQVNDNFGRTVGDQLLVAIAQRLELCLRDQDLLGRHTGDEFSVLLNGDLPQREDIDQLCRQLVEHMERPFPVAEQEVSLSLRIGIAQAPLDASSAHQLLRCADIALYQARSSKHSGWCFFTREMELRISDEQ